MALVAFLLAVVHIPGITGLQMLSGFSFLSCVLPFLLLRRIEMRSSHWLGLFFLVYATISLIWSPRQLDGIETVWHWFVLGGAFCVGNRLESLRGVFIGLGLGVSVSGIVGLFQLAGFHPVMTIPTSHGAVAGLFYNPNALSEVAAVALVGAIVYRLWWLAPGLALTLAIGQGRAAIVAISIVAVTCFVPSRWRLHAVVTAALALALAIWIKGGFDAAIMVRLRAMDLALHHLAFFGLGAGSMFIQTSDAVFDHLHNDFLEVFYEFGIGSIPFFLLVASALVRESFIKPVLFCVMVISLFSFPMFMPVTGFMAAVVTGHICRSRSSVWDYGAMCRRRIHERLGSWGYWAGENGGGDVSVQPAHPHGSCQICGGNVVRCGLLPQS